MRSPHSLVWECRTGRVQSLIVKNARNAIPLSKGLFFQFVCPFPRMSLFGDPEEKKNLPHSAPSGNPEYVSQFPARGSHVHLVRCIASGGFGIPFANLAMQRWPVQDVFHERLKDVAFFSVSLFDLRLFAFQWTMWTMRRNMRIPVDSVPFLEYLCTRTPCHR